MKSSGSEGPQRTALFPRRYAKRPSPAAHLLGFTNYSGEAEQGEIQCLGIRLPPLSYLEITMLSIASPAVRVI